jgi:hypothetical protein
LLDKITILEIKKERIGDPAALRNVAREHDHLCDIAAPVEGQPDIAPLMARLREVNRLLWDIEDQIRMKEASGRFRARIRSARPVRLQDQRHSCGREAPDQPRAELGDRGREKLRLTRPRPAGAPIDTVAR